MPRAFTDDGPYVDRFGLLLVVCVASIVGLSLFDINDPEGESAVAEIGALGGVRHGRRDPPHRAPGQWALPPSPADHRPPGGHRPRWHHARHPVALFAPELGRGDRYNPAGVVAMLSVLIPVVVVRRLLRHHRVTSATLLGAISAYLLIPLAFFHIFMAIDRWSPTPFFGEPQPSTSFMYFALVTVTTSVSATSPRSPTRAASPPRACRDRAGLPRRLRRDDRRPARAGVALDQQRRDAPAVTTAPSAGLGRGHRTPAASTRTATPDRTRVGSPTGHRRRGLP